MRFFLIVMIFFFVEHFFSQEGMADLETVKAKDLEEAVQKEKQKDRPKNRLFLTHCDCLRIRQTPTVTIDDVKCPPGVNVNQWIAVKSL